MSEDEIKNNPTQKKLRDDAALYRNFRKVWPLLKPFARLLGVDTEGIDENLEKAIDLAKQVDEMTAIPDKFNDLFSDIGWILFDRMSLDAAKQAIEIAEREGIDVADEFLADYFSPDWVEAHINWLKYIQGFQDRFKLAKIALEDYKAGRFYASILITLSLIDGWVSELNIIDFHRRGFFTDSSQLIAWDSVAAHPKGLVRLQKVFGKSRMMTRTEEIKIPYRHGIMHGMDLGYDNRFVAAKCWAALFAVMDWVIKVAKNELKPPQLEPEVERTLWESIEGYRKVREDTERLRQWQPREVIVGESIPATGEAKDFPSDTPEEKTVEFLNWWQKKNYGYMAKCFTPMMQMKPAQIREIFQGRQLVRFTLLEVNEITPAVADVKVETELKIDAVVSISVYEFRFVGSDEEGKLAYIQKEDTVWGISTWRLAE